MQWEVGFSKHIGGRGEQQDSVGAQLSADGRRCLIALADGMGGHRGGAQASRLVVRAAESVWTQVETEAAGDAKDILRQACGTAHRDIVELGRLHGLDPHTTCVMLLVQDNQATWMHIGDSRCYRIQSGSIVSRTRDHSVVQLLVDMKEVNETQMGNHPDQNKLLRSLGGSADPDAEIESAAVREGDGFVLCSDGLWESVSPEEIARSLNARSLQEEADRLAELAAERGGDEGDNVSIALARAVGEAKPNSYSAQRGAGNSLVNRMIRIVK